MEIGIERIQPHRRRYVMRDIFVPFLTLTIITMCENNSNKTGGFCRVEFVVVFCVFQQLIPRFSSTRILVQIDPFRGQLPL